MEGAAFIAAAVISHDPRDGDAETGIVGDSSVQEGNLLPSGYILRVRTDIDVVLHCHSIYTTTLACHHKFTPSFIT